jgi:hypothetical protein
MNRVTDNSLKVSTHKICVMINETCGVTCPVVSWGSTSITTVVTYTRYRYMSKVQRTATGMLVATGRGGPNTMPIYLMI